MKPTITLDLKKNPDLADLVADLMPGDTILLETSIKSRDDQTLTVTLDSAMNEEGDEAGGEDSEDEGDEEMDEGEDDETSAPDSTTSKPSKKGRLLMPDSEI